MENTLEILTFSKFENKLESFFDRNFNWEIKNSALIINLESESLEEAETEIKEINTVLKQFELSASLQTYDDDEWCEFRPQSVYEEQEEWSYLFNNFEEDMGKYLSDKRDTETTDQEIEEFKEAFLDNKINGVHIQYYVNNDPNNLDKIESIYNGSEYYPYSYRATGVRNSLEDAYSKENAIAYITEILEDE